MGCATSHLLNHDEDFTKIGSSALSHHIVSLTSTTYGLLTLDPSSSKTKTTISIFPTPGSEPRPEPSPEVINSWELMAGLDSNTESFRLYQQPSKIFHESSNLDPTNPVFQETSNLDHKNPVSQETSNPDPKIPVFQETSNLDHKNPVFQETSNLDHKNTVFQETSNLDHKNPVFQENSNLDHKNPIFLKSTTPKKFSLDEFENLCPPKGENKVVMYTTTLRGVRRTFEACNTVRTVLEGYGVFVCERDISMDSGFREELRELMKGKDSIELVPPRVFVNGRYIGGVDVVMRTMEDGSLDQLLEGLPKSKREYVCEGCGGVRFLPCFRCNGSCKMVEWKGEGGGRRKRVVVRCGDCNENGLVHCPICS
ncbi:hypothetical protein L1987_81112 [Smallanthus sonchifolius]|uniref:Uncharacterized protein n=1 Tax=Smallanthus sonchifolius TaxID=185202 RepID=A0ACB8YQN2_9ASTR|nr:hypothetical protein L1987_81112 [Smallanthus sonchifolius]